MSHFASHIEENILGAECNAQTIAGLDEVGRGALAGPFVVGCFVRNIQDDLPSVKDSKKLSEKKRHALIHPLFEKANCWSLGIVTAKEISDFGMAWANTTGFNRALQNLPRVPDLVLYDGNPLQLKHHNTRNIIRGDQTHATISASSIIAKVIRDFFMEELHNEFPYYDFLHNKGYGTLIHREGLKQYGMVDGLHRKSFVSHLLV